MATTTQAPSQALTVKQIESRNLQDIKKVVENPRYKAQLEAALKHAGIPADRMLSVALMVVNGSWQLRRADPLSLAGAILRAAIAGLVPDGQQGYLIPFKSGYLSKQRGYDVYEVQFLPSYRGYVHKAYQSKQVARIIAQNVYDKDVFELDLGAGTPPVHKFDIKAKDRGDYIASYAVIKMNNGEHLVEVMMQKDIDKIRERSKAKDDGPWKTDYEEMARKTPLRRIAKWCPDPELQRLAVIDEASEFGTDTITVTQDGEIAFAPAGDGESEQGSVANVTEKAGSDLRERLDKAKQQTQPQTIQGNAQPPQEQKSETRTEERPTSAGTASSTPAQNGAAPGKENRPTQGSPSSAAKAAAGESPSQSNGKATSSDNSFEIIKDGADHILGVKGLVTKVSELKAVGKGHQFRIQFEGQGPAGYKYGFGCWHTTWHDWIKKECVKQVCIFALEQKGEYINIEGIRKVAGDDVEIIEGKPVRSIDINRDIKENFGVDVSQPQQAQQQAEEPPNPNNTDEWPDDPAWANR